MKFVNRPSRLLSLLLMLAMVLALAGCNKQAENNPEEQSTTVKSETVVTTEAAKKEKLTVLKQLKVQNGNENYTYDYDYNFNQKSVLITCKGVPAGDDLPIEGFRWFLPASVLAGERNEAIPDVTGSYEEMVMWAQPLLASDHILTYQLVLYIEDSEEPSASMTYKFTKNTKGQVTDCEVNVKYPKSEDNNWYSLIKYRYNDDGTLRKVSEVSESRDLIWEFNRDDNGVLHTMTLQDVYRDDEAIDSWLSTTKYIYWDDGTLDRTESYGDAETGSYITTYWFSENSGNLTMLSDPYMRIVLTYDDSQTRVTHFEARDAEDSSTVYYSYDYEYETVEV